MGSIKQKIDFEDRRKIGYNYYISQGLSPIQASALIGNFIQESNLDPTASGDKNSAKGIAQWRLDRLQRLRDINGFENSENYGNQLNFALQELQTTHKKAFDRLKRAQTIEEATLAISDEFERPNKKFAANDKRIQYALDTHNKYNTPISLQQQDQPIGNIYNTQVAPYINQVQNVSNLPTPIETPILAEEIEDIEVDTEVEEAKMFLAQKQQQEINEQRFLQDILKASQVEYIDPNQSTDYTQQAQFQNGGQIVKDDMGYWNPANHGKAVEIGSNRITMKGVNEALWAVPDVGEPRIIFPNQEYIFPKATKVTEYPLKNKRFS